MSNEVKAFYSSMVEKNIQKGAETKARMLNYIVCYIHEHGYAPSDSEIAEEMGLAVGTVAPHMRDLMNMGLLETEAFKKNKVPTRAYRLGKKLFELMEEKRKETI